METKQVVEEEISNYDILKEVREFDDSKAGVKGLVDSGITKIPKFFIHPPEKLAKANDGSVVVELPVINLEGFESIRRSEITRGICEASETWGFFRIINHGIPIDVMDEVLEGVKRFHEQPKEMKMEFYTRDLTRRIKYYSTLDLHVTKIGQWRDSLAIDFEDSIVDPQGLPLVFRETMCKYVESLTKLKNLLSQLLSESLGLSSDHLARLKCLETQKLACHYYPPCPEPELTLGTTKHSDPNFLTILLQDNIGALQVLHHNQWINVPPARGSLLVNIGDLMQLITNDRFKSVEHRVVAGQVGPRVSIASFLYPSTRDILKPYGPIKEILTDANKPRYKEISIRDYVTYYMSKGLDGTAFLPHFQLQ